MQRVTTTDLDRAIEWIESYDPAPDESEFPQSLARVAVWLREEVEKRERAAKERSLVRALTKNARISPAKARVAVRKAMAEGRV